MKKILTFLTGLFLGVTALFAISTDQKLWDSILKANVDPNGFVDYPGIRINRGGDLYQYLTLLEGEDVKTMNDEEKLAFWVNAYNANVMKSVLANPKIGKMNEDPAIFDKKFRIGHFSLSLNDIRNRVLRGDPEKGGAVAGLSIKEIDPLIIFLLCDGSLGSPRLLNKSFSGLNAAEKIQSSAAEFVNDPKNVRVENGKLILSSFFQVYAKDFEKSGGVPAFISKLIDPQKRPDAKDVIAALSTLTPANTEYQYDWTVDDIKNRK